MPSELTASTCRHDTLPELLRLATDVAAQHQDRSSLTANVRDSRLDYCNAIDRDDKWCLTCREPSADSLACHVTDNNRSTPTSSVPFAVNLLCNLLHKHKIHNKSKHNGSWALAYIQITATHTQHTHTTVLRPFFRDHPGEPVSEENFWTLGCKGRLTEADT